MKQCVLQLLAPLHLVLTFTLQSVFDHAWWLQSNVHMIIHTHMTTFMHRIISGHSNSWQCSLVMVCPIVNQLILSGNCFSSSIYRNINLFAYKMHKVSGCHELSSLWWIMVVKEGGCDIQHMNKRLQTHNHLIHMYWLYIPFQIRFPLFCYNNLYFSGTAYCIITFWIVAVGISVHSNTRA